ncbi:hypothetical protein [Lactiplantibacillus plantarum]|uniref:hypothetical protein n=1 Tax=Lactiplantibacillus plantarum TaxID=1590 RepID=UPI00114227C8|nr:hypothetical protein [Lactiplantibacillus plantarum]
MDNKESNITQIRGFQSADSIDHSQRPRHNKGNDNYDGGNDMNDRYVTHKELENAELRLSSKIDLLTQKVDNKFDSLPDKIQLQIDNAEKEQTVKHTATLHWVWGTLIFGVLSTIGTITTIIISLIH